MDSTETSRAAQEALKSGPSAILGELLARTQTFLRLSQLRFDRQTALGAAASTVFVAVVRLFELHLPVNPDGFHKWDIARDLLAGHLPKAAQFDHHAARWAINLPVALLQAVFGSSAVMSYAPVLLFDLLQGIVTYLIGASLGSRAVGIVAVVLYTLVPKMNYVGSELLPTVFESAYALAALWAAIRFVRGGSAGWLHASVAFAFAAYLAKETTVFFLPGLVLGIFWARRRWLEVLIYGASFAGYLALETLAYRLTLGLRLGRLSIIAGHHLNNPRLQRPLQSFTELFDRYANLSLGMRELFFVALAITVTYPWWRRLANRSSAPTRLGALGAVQHDAYWIVLLSCWSYFFCCTFALKSLHPPQLAQPLNERYLLSALPFLALVIAGGVGEVARLSLWRASTRALRTGAVCTLLALAALSLMARGRPWSQNPLVLMPRYERVVHNAFDQGMPIVGRKNGENAVTAVNNVFLDRARSGALRCVVFKSKGGAKVCVDKNAAQFRGLGAKALRAKLSSWSKHPYVEVSTVGGFSATLRGAHRA